MVAEKVEMVVAGARKTVQGWVTGAVAPGCPLCLPPVQRAVTQDGGWWVKAGSPRSHTRTHNHPHLHFISTLLPRLSNEKSEKRGDGD